MLRTIRALVRLLAIGGVTLACWIAVLVGVAATWPWRAARRRVQRAVFRCWSRTLCRLLGARVTLRGAAPAPPCLLVTNHLSYIDVLVLATAVPARFVAKAEVRRWPLVGLISRSVDTLYVDRRSRRDALRVAREMAEGLERGDAIVLFPEGTSTHGHVVAPFKAPLLAPAAAAELPVHYAAFRYATPAGELPAHLAVCWWDDMPFAEHFWRMIQLSGFDAEIAFGAEPVRDADRKALAQRLHRRVTEIFVPVVDHLPLSTDPPPPRSAAVSPGGDRPEVAAEGDSAR
ncbi:MAG TPA: lysophospholipid acyltransferase family protein [Thermoanaerobaculia bacterium]|nr:lysophospholipid acyltransferase family protein [Thermoanaerobaculia bacterium]